MVKTTARRTISRHTFSMIFFTSAFILISCGGEQGSTKPHVPVLPLVESTSKPIIFSVQDADCQLSTSHHDLHKIQIFEWLNDTTNRRSVHLDSPYRTTSSLQSGILKKTIYDEIYSRDCDFSKSHAGNCIDANNHISSWQRTQKGHGLRICKDDFNYTRNSLEQTALTSANSLQDAYSTYQKLAPQSSGQNNLQPVTLSVQPTWRSVYHGVSQDDRLVRKAFYITNNAGFAMLRDHQSGNVEQLFLIFPENEQSMLQNNGYLWESAFVMAHEFGHYIEFGRNETAMAALGLTWSFRHHRLINSASVSSQDSAEESVLRASLSEAYADLLSLYSLHGKTASLSSIPCIGINRDITLSRFSDSQAKKLTYISLEYLFGERQPEQAVSCSDPDFTDPHTIGAIFAHTMHHIFYMTLSAYNQSDEDYSIRYRLVLNTLDEYWRQYIKLKMDSSHSTGDSDNNANGPRGRNLILTAFANGLTHALEVAINELQSQNNDASIKLNLAKEICSYSKNFLEVLPIPLFNDTTSAGDCS